MANEKVNKVVLGNEVLIDITDSTVNPNVLLAGYKAYDASGNAITGSFSPSYHITLTQAQYDLVSQQEKMADENFFYITDAVVVGADIDDTTTSSSKVWSSSKTNSEISSVNTAQNNKHKVTSFSVSTSSWSSDTTSQSGTTLYKKSISLNHVYVDSPTVEVGSASGNVLPTATEQENYDLIQYATVDSAVPCLYLYASDIPTDAFYINVVGVD